MKNVRETRTHQHATDTHTHTHTHTHIKIQAAGLLVYSCLYMKKNQTELKITNCSSYC